MPWIAAVPSAFIATLEKSGEAEVRAALDRGDEWVTHAGRQKIAEGWLARKDSAKRDAQKVHTSRLAARANLIALTAVIIAAIAAHKEIMWLISSVMSWLSN